MATNLLKATRVVNTMLGQLERETVLANLVWRDAGGSFRGVFGDTITLRVPAYAEARVRTLRQGTLVVDDLQEIPVPITLNRDIYRGVNVSDENLTLDIDDFTAQVSNPVMRAIVRGVESQLATLMSGATYQNTVTVDESDPYPGLVKARKYLNDANVPMVGRAVVVGSSIEAALLNSDRLARVDASGSDDALRLAQIGRISGFDVFTSNAIDPDKGYAFHETAYVLSSQAPIVPDGVSWGQAASFDGFAIRAIKDYNALSVTDRFIGSVYIGTNIVEDYGTIDGNGKFVPSVEVDLDEDDPIFVRAVELDMAGS